MFDKEGVLCGRVSDEADGWWSEGGAESGGGGQDGCEEFLQHRRGKHELISVAVPEATTTAKEQSWKVLATRAPIVELDRITEVTRKEQHVPPPSRMPRSSLADLLVHPNAMYAKIMLLTAPFNRAQAPGTNPRVARSRGGKPQSRAGHFLGQPQVEILLRIESSRLLYLHATVAGPCPRVS